MATFEKNGFGSAGVTRSGEEYMVEMRIRVTVTASSMEDAVEKSSNTMNWREWQWLGPRMAGKKPA